MGRWACKFSVERYGGTGQDPLKRKAPLWTSDVHKGALGQFLGYRTAEEVLLTNRVSSLIGAERFYLIIE